METAPTSTEIMIYPSSTLLLGETGSARGRAYSPQQNKPVLTP